MKRCSVGLVRLRIEDLGGRREREKSGIHVVLLLMNLPE